MAVTPASLTEPPSGASPSTMVAPPGRLIELQMAMEMAGLGLWIWPSRKAPCTWNAQLYALVGRSPMLPGYTLRECMAAVHPVDQPRMQAWLGAVVRLRTSARTDGEVRIVRRDGTVRWVALRAQHVVIDGARLLLGTVTDVTERAQAEDALGHATERVALAARAVGLGAWEWNVVTGASTWDDTMFHLRGLPVGPHAPNADERLQRVHPDDRALVDAVLGRAAAGEHVGGYEFRVIWPDGTVRWLASRSSRLETFDGTLRYVGVNWDVTERRLAQQARDEAFIVEQESRAKASFLSRMSHELRTPLNAVMGFAQLMQLDAEQGKSPRVEHLQHVRHASEYLLSLVDEVLDLSNLDAGITAVEEQPVMLGDIVRDALPLLAGLATTLQATLRAGRLDGVVRGDAARLHQVTVQLLTTALHGRETGGVVFVETLVTGAEVVLRVRNAGWHLPAEQLSLLFEPFNRLDAGAAATHAHGIGLAVGAALVKRMGGQLRATSDATAGTLFEARLPRAEQLPVGAPSGTSGLHDVSPEVSQTTPPPAVGSPSQSPVQILYIEDNPVNVLLIEALVSTRSDLQFSSAATGLEGLAAAARILPALVLVDLHLPDIDGFEVLRRLRAQPETAGLRCVALSANAVAESIADALSAGFSDYWTKPVNVPAFLATLQTLFPVQPS